MAEAMAAARLGDPVGHGLGLAGMVAGAVAGAVIGAALLGATVVTGGAAGVFAAAAIAGMVGGGALAGGQLVNGLQTVLGLSNPTTGTLAQGSPDVRVNGRPAVRAGVDFVASCTGLYGLNHLPKQQTRVAEGSATVRVNGKPAGRVEDRLECAATISAGSPNVTFGGPTEAALPVAATNEDVARQLAQVMVVVGAVGALGLAGVAGGALGVAKVLGVGVGFTGLDMAVGWVGDQIGPGWRDTLQGVLGVGTLLASPRLARGAQQRATAQRVRANVAASQRARAASGFGGRTSAAGSRAALTPAQQARASLNMATNRARATRVASAQARQRRALASDFYRQQGFTPDRIPDHLQGIDFNRPVEVVELRHGTVLEQWQAQGRGQGNYYAPPGTSSSQLGIAPVSTDPATGVVSDRVVGRYVVDGGVRVLRSTAAPVIDTWSLPGQRVPTDGGGTQYFTTNRNNILPWPPRP